MSAFLQPMETMEKWPSGRLAGSGKNWMTGSDRNLSTVYRVFDGHLCGKDHAYSGEEVTFLNERLEGNYAEVQSRMVGKKTEIPMDYRLMKKGDDWKAYD